MTEPGTDRYGIKLLLLIAAVLAITGAVLLLLFRPQLAAVVGTAGAATPTPSVLERHAEDPVPAGSPAAPIAEVVAGAKPSGPYDVRSGPGTAPALAPVAGQGSRDRAVSDAAPRTATLHERARAHSAAGDWVAAIRAYDRLLALEPRSTALAWERARVLAWSGRGREAAAAARAAGATDDPAVRLEVARFLSWDGDAAGADSVLATIHVPAMAAAVDSVRSRVRSTAEPDAALAARWIAVRDGPHERLLLARALVREGRAAAAVPQFQLAVDDPVTPDAVLLELADAAVAADSVERAARALDRYVRRNPDDHRSRLRLARVYSWTGEFPASRREYEALLARGDDPALRLELARVDAWAGEFGRAEAALRRLVREAPRDAEPMQLLGDVARWRGDGEEARRWYLRVQQLEPGREGLAEAIAALGAERPDGNDAAVQAGDRWTGSVDAFGDTERFRWLSSRASREWDAGRGTLRFGVRQDLLDGAAPEGTGTEAGYGAELGGSVPVGARIEVAAGVGIRGFGSGVRFGTLEAGVVTAVPGGKLSLAYRHEPAVRRVATAAALRAGVVSDAVALTASLPLGSWHLWSQLEAERLRSEAAATGRATGGLSLSRPIAGGLSGVVSLGAISTDGASPVLDGWGPLYWAPQWYVAPAAGAVFDTALSDRLSVRVRMLPGYAWFRERDGVDRRFADDRTLTLGTGVEARYQAPGWLLELGGDWGGGIESGYHASALSVRITRDSARP